MITIDDTTTDPAARARALLDKAADELIAKAAGLNRDGRLEEAISACDALVARFGNDPDRRRQVAQALSHKGAALNALGRDEDDIAVHDEMVRRFGGATEPSFQLHVARALLSKGFVQHRSLGRFDEALATFDEVVTRYGDGDASGRAAALQALVNRVDILAGLGHEDEYFATCDEMVMRYDRLVTADHAEVPDGVAGRLANALSNKARLLARRGLHDDALADLDDVLTYFGHRQGQRFEVARALDDKASLLDDLGRHEDELAVYDEILRRFGPEPDLRENVARALIDKGITLSHNLGRLDDAFACYDELIARFGDANDVASCSAVVEALLNRAELLDIRDRPDETLATYDEIVARYDRLVARDDAERHTDPSHEIMAVGVDGLVTQGSEPPPELRDRVAAALHNKGLLLKEHDQHDRALVAIDEVLVRFEGDPHPSIRQVTAHAHQARGQTLAALGRIDEAITAFDDVIALHDDADELVVRQQLFEAVVNKAATLTAAERADEAIALYPELNRHFDELVRQIHHEGLDGDADEAAATRVHELGAAAVLNHGIALSLLDRTDEQLAVYDNLVAYHDALAAGDDDPPPTAIRQAAAEALIEKANILVHRDRSDDADVVLKGMLARFADDPDLEEAVAEAHYMLDDEDEA